MEDTNTNTNTNNTYNILKGILTGILSAYVVLFALRPSVPNPDIILEIIENKYIFIPLLIINYYLFEWDKLIGILFTICLISLIFDYFIFIKKNFNNDKNIEKFINYNNIRKKIINILEL